VCTEDNFASYCDLQIHFFDVHDLKMKGFSRSRGLQQKKPRSGSDPRQAQDIAQDEDDDSSLDDLVEELLDLKNIYEEDLEDNETDWTDDDGNWEDNSEEGITVKEQTKRKMLGDIHVCKRKRL
jgi:hypothetical protein